MDKTQMYGATFEDIKKYLKPNGRFCDDRNLNRHDWGMLAASILSDAQEEISMGNKEKSTQFINRAKYVIFNILSYTDSPAFKSKHPYDDLEGAVKDYE